MDFYRQNKTGRPKQAGRGIRKETASAIAGMVLFELIIASGSAAGDIEQATGLNKEQMNDPDARVEMDSFLKLWQMAVDATGDPALGLHLQKHFGTSLMHFVVTIAINSQTLLEALQSWARYDRLICETDHIRILDKQDHYVFVYTNIAPEYQNRWIPEQYFSLALEYGRRISGQKIVPLEVRFVHPAPAYSGEYEKVFKCPVLFGKKENIIRFKKEDMHQPVVSPDPYLKAVLVKQADESLKKLGVNASAASRVAAYIRKHLHKGDVTMKTVSAALNMDRSTLYRHLSRENTSFKAILENTRKELAKKHLLSGLTASQTAYLLGFTEPSAFQRAFKRWFDVSPGEFKNVAAGLEETVDNAGYQDQDSHQ